jgi:hypothetical protein
MSRKPGLASSETTAPENTEVVVSRFGVFPDGSDATRGLSSALEYCRAHSVKNLIFPKGIYNFHPCFAKEKYLHVCNNDEGLKRIAFLLEKLHDLTIDGQGSSFLFHGFINPFFVTDSSKIILKNFSIDFSRSFHSEGLILNVDESGIDLKISQKFPFALSNGILRFVGYQAAVGQPTSVSKDDVYGSNHLLEYSTELRETAIGAKDYFLVGSVAYPAKKLTNDTVRLLVPGLTGEPGNTLVLGPSHRDHPAIVLNRCQQIVLKNITIHHAGGMGVVAQVCHDISILDSQVTPSQGRLISTTADATHFVNCTGRLTLRDNLFENQLDDATNIHGIYLQITEILSENDVIVRWAHHQQHGFHFLRKGLHVEFIHPKRLQEIGTGELADVSYINKERACVRFKNPIPKKTQVGDCIADITAFPEVTIEQNIIRNNRARGMLLNCRGKTRVTNNHFHTPGAAILFEGDACFWFEQGGVKDCLISGNTFENCLYGIWGKAIIDVQAGIHENRETARYNRNITIENNKFFRIPGTSLLHAYCVETLAWRNNSIEDSSSYPTDIHQEDIFKISFSSNVSIMDDSYCD